MISWCLVLCEMKNHFFVDRKSSFVPLDFIVSTFKRQAAVIGQPL